VQSIGWTEGWGMSGSGAVGGAQRTVTLVARCIRAVVAGAAVVVGVVLAATDALTSGASSLPWALIAFGAFAFVHLAIDALWTSAGADGGPPDPGANPLGLIMAAAGAMVALIGAFGTNISTTTIIGLISLVLSLLVGLALSGLGKARRGSLPQGLILIVLRNVLLASFGFGAICLVAALASKGQV
jgi:hypothetical protein